MANDEWTLKESIIGFVIIAIMYLISAHLQYLEMASY